MMNSNEVQFSNVQSPPTVAQPATPAYTNARIKLNRDYLLSPDGILRLLIVIFQFCAWVSAAAVPVLVSGQYFMPADFAATRSAYLFFSIVGWLLGIIIYGSYLMNIVNLNGINKVPWHFVVSPIDFFYIFINRSTVDLA